MRKKKKIMFKQYYQMAIKLGNSGAMNNLAYYYGEEEDYDQAILYYQMAIKLGNSIAMNNLANYYYKKEDYDQSIKYVLMAIELGNSSAMKSLSFMTTVSPIKVFMEIDLIENPNEFIINLKKELKKNHKVIIFENKKRLSIKYNIIEYCPICLDTKLCINLDCGHFVCVDCYNIINCCYLKCCG